MVSGIGSGAIGDPTTITGAGSYSLGNDNTIEADNAGAFGNDNTLTAAADGSRVVGNTNTVSGPDALALGNRNTASGEGSVAIGRDSISTGLQSFALGDEAEATGQDALAIGTASDSLGLSSTAFGRGAWATADYAAAFGAESTASGEESTAIGSFSQATLEDSVALGSNSVADTGPGILGYKPLGASAADAAAVDGTVATQSAVDIGSRQITSVAAGTQLDDAVNVSQLIAAQSDVAAGTNIADVTASENLDGGTIYTVNANGASVSAGDGVDVTPAGPDANNVTDYEVALNQTTKDSLDLADSSLQTVVTQIDGVDVKTIDQNDNVANFIEGKNIDLIDNGGSIEVATLDNVTFTDVQTDTLTAGPVNIGAAGIDAGSTTISSVAPGVAGTDAVNVNQLDDAAAASKTEVTGGTNIAGVTKATGANGQDIYTVNADGASVSAGDGVDVTPAGPDANNVTDYEVALNQTTKDSLDLADSALQTVVTQIDGTDVKTIDENDNVANFVTGDNIVLTDETGDIKIATSPTLTADSLTINNGGPVISDAGIDMGGNTISNVTDGVAPGDAVNLSQLEDTAAASKTEVTGGTNIAGVTKATGANGQDIYTVNADGASVSAGDGVDVTPAGPDANNVTDYEVALNQTTKDSLDLADSALQTVVTQIDGTDVKTIDENDNVANFVTGDNIVLTDETGDIKIATSPTLTADSLTINNGGPVISDAGIDMGGDTITNLGDPVNGGDAVNLDYFDENRAHYYSVNDDGTQQGNYDNDGATGINALAAGTNAQAMGNSSTAVGDGARTGGNADNQVAVGSSALAGGQGSIAIGNNAKASTNGQFDTPVGGQMTVAIGDGANAQGTDNVAVGSGSLADGLTLGTAAYQPVDVDGNPIAVAADEADSEFSVGDTGFERRVTNVAAGAEDTDAVNVSQLKAVNELASTGWNVQANGDTATNVAPGDTVQFIDGKNIDITRNGADITVATADSVVFDDVTITGGPTLTGGGIDMNNTAISNLADGVNAQDAVNVSQLENSAAASRTEVTGGTNIASVDQTTGADGQDIYTVNADGASVSAGSGAVDVTAAAPDADNVTDYAVDLSQASKDSLTLADSALQTVVTQIDGTDVKTLDENDNVANFVTGDNIVLTDDAGGIKIATADDVTFTSINSDSLAITGGPTLTGGGIDMNNTTISNLADGVNAQDAVNLSQLENSAAASKTEVAGGTNVASVDKATGVNGQDIYTVNADGASVSAGSAAVDVTAAAPDANNITDYAVDLSQASKDSLTLADSALQTVVTQIDGTDVKTLDENDNVANFVTGDNIVLSDEAGGIKIATSPNLTADSLTINNGPTLNDNGIDMGGDTITNLGDPINDGDALNLKYFDENRTRYYSVNDGGTIGGNFNNDGATGLNAIASGVNATASGDGAVAMGFGASAPINDSLALGSGSVVDRALAPDSGFIPAGSATIEFNTTDKELLGAISVGDDDSYRQITNVADGTEAQDAVTVRQLQGAVGSVIDSGTKYFRANSTEPDSLAVGNDSIAVGPTTVTNGDNGIGMGNGAIVGQMAPGGTAIGNNAEVLLSDGIAFGTNARSEAQQGIALGAGATVSHDQSVALGSNSVTEDAVATSGVTIAGDSYTFAGTTPDSTVSIGSAGNERTLTNVAAGRVSETSTDAINGSQLFASNQAIEEVSTIANTGWDIQTNGDTATNVAPGDTVQMIDGQNIAITRNGTDITVATVDSPQFGNVTVNTGGGDTINGLSNLTFDPDNFTSGQAASEDQLKQVSDIANTGWNVQANGDTATNVAPGDTVQFIDGKNIDITRNGPDITVATADSVVFDDVAITGGPTLTGGGIDMNNTTISNLADGVNAQDAVNLSQLENSAAASKTEVAGGTNVASVDKATGVNGQDIYTVNADGASVSAGSGAVDVTAAAPGADNVTDYAVDLSQASKNSLTLADSALQTVVTQIDGTEVKTLDQNDNVANFISGNNIELSDDNGAIEIATSADLTADSLTINNGGPTLNDNGIDMNDNRITNVGEAVDGGDAINLDYFDANRTRYYSVNDGSAIGGNFDNDGATGLNAIASGVDATASGDGAVAMGFGASAPINDSLALGSGSVVDRALAPDSGFIPAGSATIEFNTTDKELLGAISVGDDDSYRQITNVADGTEAQDAVTVRQLQGAVGSVITTGIKYYRANSDDPDAIAAGEDSLAIGPNTVTNGDNGIGMGNGAIVGQMAPGGTAIGNNAEVLLSDGIAFGTNARSEAQQGIALGAGATVSHDQSVALGSNSVTEDAVATSGVTIAGDSYTFAGTTPDSTVSIGSAGNERTLTNVAAGRVSETSTDAINGSQLFASNQAIEEVSTIANTGWDIQTNGDTATNVAPGDTVQMIDGQNIAITRNGTDITVATVDSPQFGNVTVNTGGGDTINGLSNLTFDPDNFTSGQAASEDQLKQVSDIANTGWNVQANGDTATNVAPGDTVQFIDGKNIDITRNGPDITVATADSVVFDDVAITGGPTLTGGGIDMNATTISNLSDGVNANDAVNLSQLENSAAASKTEVAGGTNVASVDKATGVNGQDIYTVNADGASVSAGSGAVDVTAAAPDANNITDYAVDLSQASKDSLTLADSALQTVVTQIDGTEVKTLDQNDNVANFVTGDNIVLSDEAGGIKIATSPDLTADSLTINNGPTLNDNGIDMGGDTITNLGDPINDGDALNLKYFDENRTRYYSVNDGGTIGGNYNNDGATGLNAIASGVNATASGDGAVAMGFGASAPINDSLALGSGSVVDRALAPDSGFIPAGSATIEFNTTDKELLGAISVGDDDSYRQITNVADGTEAQDAVTVRQLQGAVGSVITTGIKYYRANSDDPDAIAAGEDSLAIGPNTVTNGDNGIGMGNGAIVGQMAPGGTAIGNNAEVLLSDGIAFGTNARSEAQQGIALGAGATVSHDQSVALGSNSVTEDAVATSGVTIAGDSYTFAGTTPDSTVSIGSAGNERTLTNVAAGRVSETSTDAINGSQLFASNLAIEQVSTIANKGWNLQANGDTATNVAPGDTVQFLDGKNVDIARSDTDITVATADDVAFDSAMFIDGPTINGDGIDMNSTTISNLADGVNAQDAVNLSQLQNSAAASRTEVAGGSNVASVDQTTGADGQAIYTVNADGASVSAGSGAVDVTATAPDADNVTDYAVDLSQASKDSLTLADSALQTVVTQIDGTDVKTLDQNDNVANFISGQNIELSDDGGAIEIATSSDLTADSLTINNGPTLNGNGIDMGGNSITNLGDPVNDGDALNLQYFNENRVRYFSVNDNGVVGGNFNNDGATGLNAMASGVGAIANGEGAVAMGFGANALVRGSLAIGSGSISDRALAPESGFITAGSATIEYNTTDKELLGAISVGDSDSYRQIINVADGTEAQDAVTVRQLQGAIGSVVNTGTKYFHANSTAPDSLAAGNDSIAVGPTTVTNGDNGIGMGNGAIVGQMAPGGTAIGNNAEVLLSDGIAFGTNARSEAQQGIAFGAGATVSHDQSVALGSNSTTDESVATQGITLIGNDYSFAGTTPDSTVSIGSAGNERTLTNVAAGRVSETSTDAINGSQLFASNQAIEEVSAVANAGWNVTDGTNAANIGPNGEVTFTGDSNLTVAQTGIDDAGEVEITLNRDLDLDSVTAGNSELTSAGLSVDDGNGNLTTVTNDGLTIAGGPSITASGGIDANNQVISNVGTPVDDGDALNLQYFNENRARYYSVNDGGTIGGNFNNDGATGLNAIASGVDASASGEDAVAMGFGANAPIRGSLALGSGSVVDRALAPDSGFIPAGTATIEFNTTDKELLGAISVGDSDSYRQITNVADGTQAQDAVTVRQLQGAVGSVVESGTKYFRANSSAPDAAAVGNDSIAVGPTTVTNGDNGIGIGNGAIVGQMAPGGTAIGDSAEVLLSDGIAFGSNARSEAQQGIALGAGATVSHDQSVALGSNSTTDESVATQGITLIGNDYSFAGTTPTSTISVGSVGNERTITNVAAGRVSATSTDAINGSQLFASNQAIEEVSATANAGWNLSVEDGEANNVAPTGEVNLLSDDGNILITQATVNDREEVAFGLSDDLSVANSLTVGQDGPVISNEGITNLAEGDVSADSKDAINGSQLYATNQWIEVLENSVTNVVGDGSDEYITNNGLGIRYVRTNDSGLAVSDAFAQGQGSTAVGYEAVASADRALAMGYDAIASHQGSVALGKGARTAAAVGTASVEIAGQTYQFAGTSPVATVSVGSVGAERTVTNVAAGRISAESTDAINGSQLYATNQAVGALDNRVTTVEGDISNITNDLADLDDRAVQYDRNDDGSVDYNTITLEGDGGTKITNVAPGDIAQNSSDAVNGSQLWDVQNQITNIEQGGSKYFRANSDGPAADPQGADSIAMGPGSVASGDRSVASGAGAQANAEGSVALGADSVADREGMNGERERFSNESVASTQGAVSVGSAGNERQITNVAGGTRDTDAVNVRQLDAVQRGAVNYDRDEDGNVDYSTITLKGDEGTTITNVAPGINANDAANVGQLNDLGRRFENEIVNVYGRIDDVERNANAGSASAIAASTVPQAWMPGKSMIGVGAGTYGGESAVSVGISRLSDNGRWVIQGKVTGDSQSNFGAGIGAGWHW
ncbi:YadA-like family protein [Vreelandella sp. 21]|uniref:YadA-like family protein n=1 Tax=Vreelandella sp. 21 TaxID=3402864 RepID=UPI003D9A252F